MNVRLIRRVINFWSTMGAWERGEMMNDSHAFLRYLNAQPKLSVRPSLLLLVPFLGTVPLYVSNARVMRDLFGAGSAVDSMLPAMIVTCLVLSIACMLFAAKHPDWIGFRGTVLAASAVGYAIALGTAWAMMSIQGVPDASFAGLGIVLGICVVPVIMAWIGLFAMDVRNAMLYGAFSCIGASLLAWTMSLLPIVPAIVLSVVCATAGAVAPVVMSAKRHDTPGIPSDSTNEAIRSGSVSVARIGASLRNLLSVIWLPLLGFLVCVFMSASCEFSLNGATLRSEFIGGVIASAIAVTLCLVQHETPFVLLVDKLVVPALVAMSIVLGSFPAGSSPFYLGASFIFAPMMFLSLFALASLVAIAAAGEFSLPFVFGAGFFSSNGVALLGLALGGGMASTDAIGPVLWVVICAYFAIVVVQLGCSSWRQLCRPSSDEGAASDSELDYDALELFLRRRVECLADSHGLTNRERELLDFLSRGYGSQFIAKNLFISDNTARTHIRNIYRKLGVASREELLSLFNDRA